MTSPLNNNHVNPIKLNEVVNKQDKLYRLERMIDWDLLSTQYTHKFDSGNAPSPRLLFGLLYLQAKENIDSEELMQRWETTPEWQYFCGEKTLHDRFPLQPAQLSIWRREIGENGCKLMCAALARSLPALPALH